MAPRNLALAGRTLRNSPIFTLTAAVTIALRVGASTATLSLMNAVLLRARRPLVPRPQHSVVPERRIAVKEPVSRFALPLILRRVC